MDAFRRKARVFLRPHENHIAVLKVKRNEPLTPTDLKELERIFLEAGVDEARSARCRPTAGLPRFVRCACRARPRGRQTCLCRIPGRPHPTADQIEFVDLVIDHLTARGVMDPKLLYEAPSPISTRNGVEGVFEQADVVRLVRGAS